MKLNTGKVFFNIKFDDGSETNISFNPHDRDFMKRIMDYETNVNKKLKEIDLAKYKDVLQGGVSIDLEDFDKILEMGKEQFEDTKNKIKALQEIDEEYSRVFKEELDNIFKTKVSENVFKYCEPMDMVTYTNEDGEEVSELFIIHFLREFSKELNARRKDISHKAQKYIKNYE